MVSQYTIQPSIPLHRTGPVQVRRCRYVASLGDIPFGDKHFRELGTERSGAHNLHNHPSGVKDQSQADELITKRIAAALALIEVRVLDHLIIGADSVLSFSEMGLL
jgi:hypothetical protein